MKTNRTNFVYFKIGIQQNNFQFRCTKYVNLSGTGNQEPRSASHQAQVQEWQDVKQEAPLSPRDRTMRHVSWNLPTATQQCRNYCTTSPEQIEVMKLKRYSKAMCNKRALNHDAIESLSLSCRYHKQTDNGRVVDIHTYA